MCPFEDPRGRHYLPPAEKAFNRQLSSVRIAVENSFGQTQQQWTYTAFSKGLKEGWQPVAAYFAAAVLLSNCYTCIRGNSISGRFMVTPPTVELYLYL
jgi:hypothetical protein